MGGINTLIIGAKHYMLRAFYALFLFLTALPLFAQAQVSGKVTMASGEGLQGASVVLKDANSKIAAYAIASEGGAYSLQPKAPGDYVLEANFMGFKKQGVAIKVAEGRKMEYDFALEESDEVLKEVVIEAEAPVKLRGDTLVYDAKALRTGHEVVVEDLLKNIPGITVLKDGTIKFGDTQIEKVMVDGDDLFSRGYSVLTKNMPSQPLDKIEVLQNYSNNKLLKGIEDSQGVALNLTLLDEYKNIWFGNTTLGYGIENRYSAHGFLTSFSKAHKTVLNVDLNNAGYDNIGNIEGMFYSTNDMETPGLGYSAVKVMGVGARRPRLDEDRSRFNDAESATLSSVIPLSPKAKLNLRGFLGFNELYAYHNSLSVVDFDGTYFENRESNISRTGLQKGYVSAFLNYDLTKTSMLQASSGFNSGNSDFRNDLTFNGTATREQLETRNTFVDQKLTYTHKWKERNVVLLKARFFTDKLPQEYAIDDYLLGDLFPYDNIQSVGNNVKSSKQYSGLQADFKLKQKNGSLIEFITGFDYNDDDLATRFSLFTDEGVINPADFQSASDYSVGDLYLRSGYTFKFNKVSLGLKGDAHQLFNRFSGKNGKVTQNPFYINPNLNFAWEIKPDNVLSASYNYKVTNSGLLYVNDAYLLTSSRGFTKGLGYFNQLENHGGGIRFSTKHYLNRYSFSWGVDYSKQYDDIRYRSQIDQNSSLSEAFVMKGGDQIAVRFGSHMVVKKLQGTMKLDLTANKTVYYNEINDSGLRKNTLYSQTVSFGWTSSFKSAFNFSLGTDWDFSQVKSDNTFKNTSKTSFLDLMYLVNENLSFKLKSEHYNFGGLDRYNNYFFADLEASYSFKKGKYNIGLNARNLFDTDTFTTYSVSDIGYSTNSYRLLPRYVMVTFRFRFGAS